MQHVSAAAAPSAKTLALAGALVTFAVHAAFWYGYGWFRDEFYYLACAAHLDYGYVDHPALSIVPLWIVRQVVGDSLLAIRLIAAAVAGAVVFVIGMTAAALGAGAFGQMLAMTCALVAPEYLATGSFYSMNVWDVLFWAASAWIVVELLKRPRWPLWIALGVVLGLGLENKISVLWLGGGLALGLAATADRRLLRTPGPWVAALIALTIFAPYVLWQIRHGWPTVEFIRRASGDKMASHSALSFLMSQVTDMHPLTAPVWIAGLVFYLWSPAGRAFRVLGVAFAAVAALLIADSTTRTGYLAAAYSFLFAAGGVQIERILAAGWRHAGAVILALLVTGGVVTAPLAMPILPIDRYIRYGAGLNRSPETEERKEVGALSQFYADRFGWHEMVAAVGAAYASLAADERRVAAIFASNYGEAGAIDVLGHAHGLPRATSGHNNYWLWGPGSSSGEVVIVLAPTTPERLVERFGFRDVRQAGTVECGLCMPYENHRPIFIARSPKQPWATFWPALKHFD